MTSIGGSCIGKVPPTKQTDLVTLPVVLHEELISGADVRIEVPGSSQRIARPFEMDAAPCNGQVCSLG